MENQRHGHLAAWANLGISEALHTRWQAMDQNPPGKKKIRGETTHH